MATTGANEKRWFEFLSLSLLLGLAAAIGALVFFGWLADEVLEGENWRLELVNLAGGAQVGRLSAQPGWRWSEHLKPAVGTELCMAPHQQYHLSGRLHVVMQDGSEIEAGPGDVTSLPPGHDAWVVGDDPVVAIDWQGASVWARPRDSEPAVT